TLDLTDQEGGRYQLVITDAGACSPINKFFEIQIRNTLSITEGVIKNTTCNRDNGTINQVVIYNADQYEWFDPAGNPIGGKVLGYTSGTTLPILENLKVGRYRLVASLSNATCTKEQFFNVTAIVPTQYQFT
ncbi:gliding motility-associated C-terminal domain-containing protein, partial [Micromonospora chalcea]